MGSHSFSVFAVKVCVLTILGASSVFAEGLERTAFDNLGPNDTYLVGAAWAVRGSDAPPRIADLTPAMKFEPSISGSLHSIEIPLREAFGFANSVPNSRILLLADDQGLPAQSLGIVAELDEVSIWSGSFSSRPEPLNILSDVDVFLSRGQTYWLAVEAASPLTSVNWGYNTIGDRGRALRHGGTWGYVEDTDAGAFRVFVTVPEPNTFTITCICMALGLAVRRKGPGAILALR